MRRIARALFEGLQREACEFPGIYMEIGLQGRRSALSGAEIHRRVAPTCPGIETFCDLRVGRIPIGMTSIGDPPSPVLAEQGMTCTVPHKRGLWSALYRCGGGADSHPTAAALR